MIAPAVFYNHALESGKLNRNRLVRITGYLSLLRLLTGIIIIFLIFFSFRNGAFIVITMTLLTTAVFLALVRVHSYYEQKLRRVLRRIDIAEQELAALQGNYSHFYDGKDFSDSLHPYSLDLDIFGERSVYQMLCRTVTIPARAKLAKELQYPYAPQLDLLQKQSVVQALSSHPDFLIDFRVTGAMFEEHNNDIDKVTGWLKQADLFIQSAFLRSVIWIIPVLTLTAIVLSVTGSVIHPLLYIVAIFNWIVLGRKSVQIKQTSFYVARSADLIAKYEALTGEIARRDFDNNILIARKQKMSRSLEHISRFRQLAHIFESRYNGMVGPLMNTFFLFDIQCAVRLEQWRKQHHKSLLETLEELLLADMQISLATYAFNHPDYVYPEFIQESRYSASDMKHPLLQHNAVGNDFSIGNSEQIYLLTGANMTGKSTFIRTVGVNLILSYTGVPLWAAKAYVPAVRLFTAIRISDSVQDDVSYFKAELNRIQAMMNVISDSEDRYMIMLDEPLRGTNITDKQLGTRAIAEKLIRMRALGIIATHDTILCSLEESSGGIIRNFHFESTVVQDTLSFDYRLKPGGSTSNNATILMQQMGII